MTNIENKPTNRGVVATSTTLLATPVRDSEAIQNRKCSDRNNPERKSHRISLPSSDRSSSITRREPRAKGNINTVENMSLNAAIAIEGAPAKRMKIAAKETDTIATTINPFVLNSLSIIVHRIHKPTEAAHSFSSSNLKLFEMNCIEPADLIKYILIKWR